MGISMKWGCYSFIIMYNTCLQEHHQYWNFGAVRKPQFYPRSPNLLVKLFSAICRGIMLQICSNYIKMGSLELGLSTMPKSADFIDPL